MTPLPLARHFKTCVANFGVLGNVAKSISAPNFGVASPHTKLGNVAKSISGPTMIAHPACFGYVVDHCRLNDAQKELMKQIEGEPHARMSGSPDVAQLLGWLIEVTGAKKCLEVGVFKGFSTLAFALAVPEDGKPTTFTR